MLFRSRYDIELEADPFDVYRVLRQVNPSPYMYFIRHDEATLVGSSPEPMVQLRGDHIVSRPIAGTRKRGLDEEDARDVQRRRRRGNLVVLDAVQLGRGTKFDSDGARMVRRRR